MKKVVAGHWRFTAVLLMACLLVGAAWAVIGGHEEGTPEGGPCEQEYSDLRAAIAAAYEAGAKYVQCENERAAAAHRKAALEAEKLALLLENADLDRRLRRARSDRDSCVSNAQRLVDEARAELLAITEECGGDPGLVTGCLALIIASSPPGAIRGFIACLGELGALSACLDALEQAAVAYQAALSLLAHCETVYQETIAPIQARKDEIIKRLDEIDAELAALIIPDCSSLKANWDRLIDYEAQMRARYDNCIRGGDPQ